MAQRAIIKPGDLVRTPTGRTARVQDLRPDGRRELVYTDRDGGEVALAERDLTLVTSVPPTPWAKHR